MNFLVNKRRVPTALKSDLLHVVGMPHWPRLSSYPQPLKTVVTLLVCLHNIMLIILSYCFLLAGFGPVADVGYL